MDVSMMNKQNFLSHFNITEESLDNCKIEWELLQDIAQDHEKNKTHMQNSAREIANTLNLCEAVHTVSWRVKDTAGLLKKILRKKTEIASLELGIYQLKEERSDNSEAISYTQDKLDKLEKWRDISVKNYFKIVTDLVGVRALHIFLDGCLPINSFIRENWDLTEGEKVIIYTVGEHFEFVNAIPNSTVEAHRKGYRSIHYIIESKPRRRVLKSEIQVRTIFQEGWGEIDHMINYPESSSQTDVQNFLVLFSTLAGNADAMGSFVQQLSRTFASVHTENETMKVQHRTEIDEQNKVVEGLKAKVAALEKSGKGDNVKSILDDLNFLGNTISKKGIESKRLAKNSYNLADALAAYGSTRNVNSLLTPTTEELKAQSIMAKWKKDEEVKLEALKLALGPLYPSLYSEDNSK